MPCAVNLMDAAEARRLILTVVEAERATGFNPKVVIVDTLHRSMPGADENSSQHMGIAISNCALIQAELKCTLMPVTHTGKDTERGMRGSNSLLGASDAVARVTRTDDRVTVTTEKMKDAEDGQVLNLKSVKVNLPPAAGSIRPRDSLVLITDEEPPAKRGNKLAPTADKARQFLADLIAAEGVPLPSGSGFPSSVQGRQIIGVSEKRWREECETRRLSPAVETKGRNQAFGRAFRDLLDEGEVAAKGEFVWLVRQGHRDGSQGHNT